MRVAAIYCAWFDGIELLPFSIVSISKWVDDVIIIYSNTSNHRETIYYQDKLDGLGVPVNWEPDLSLSPHQNEVNKRNFGLDVARSMEFTHFIMMDCDECYESLEIERRSLENSVNMNGFVHACRVYVKTPNLWCADHTLVTGLHRINKDTRFEFGSKTYPFAYDSEGHAHIDPTRRLNYKHGIAMSGQIMHHFSHVRKDIRLKIRNSSARKSLENSTILEDYENAKEGYYSKFYRKTLHSSPNIFGISIP